MARHWRTLGLWGLLIAMFFAMYMLFSSQQSGGAVPTRTAAVGGDSVWLAVLVQWLPLVVIFLAFVFWLRVQRRKGIPHDEGVRFLNQGRYLQALERFAAYRQREPKQAVAAFNTAVARLQLWRLEDALADLQTVESLQASRVNELSEWVPEHQALVLALLGRTAEAREKLRAIPLGKGDSGRIALTEAIVLARGGDSSGARARLGSFEVKHLGGPLGALARTLDAMCIERLTGERRNVDRVALYGEASPDGLQRAWPELVAFVERAPAW